MPRQILLEENVLYSSGLGPVVAVPALRGRLVIVTLGITRIIPHETVEVSVWGSTDGRSWGGRPLATLPRKSYCGLYSAVLNLAPYPGIEFLRSSWTVESRGPRDSKPMFGAYIYLEESGARCVPNRLTGSAMARPDAGGSGDQASP